MKLKSNETHADCILRKQGGQLDAFRLYPLSPIAFQFLKKQTLADHWVSVRGQAGVMGTKKTISRLIKSLKQNGFNIHERLAY